MKHLFAFLGNIFVAIVTTSDHASNKKSEFDRFRICPFILLLEAILDLCWDNKLPRKTTNKLNIQNLKINSLFSSKNNNRVKTRDKETNFFKTLMKLFSIVTNKTACQSIFRSRRGNIIWNISEKLHSFSKDFMKKCYFEQLIQQILTVSWRRSLSCRNQFIDLQKKSMDWGLYDRGPPSRKS